MSKIKLMFVVIATVIVMGWMFSAIVRDTEEMNKQYQQCLESKPTRLCNDMFFR